MEEQPRGQELTGFLRLYSYTKGGKTKQTDCWFNAGLLKCGYHELISGFCAVEQVIALDLVWRVIFTPQGLRIC